MTANEFKQKRLESGLTQAEFAAKLGKHPETVGRWERGTTPIPEPIALLLSSSVPFTVRVKRKDEKK